MLQVVGTEQWCRSRFGQEGMGRGWRWRVIFLVSLGSSGCSLGAEAREGVPWESPVSSLGFIPSSSLEHFGLWLSWWFHLTHMVWFWELRESPKTPPISPCHSFSQGLSHPATRQVKFTFSDIHRSSTLLNFKLGFDECIYHDTKA